MCIIYIYIYTHICTHVYILCVCMCVSLSLYIYIYIYIYVYICIYTYTYKHHRRPSGWTEGVGGGREAEVRSQGIFFEYPSLFEENPPSVKNPPSSIFTPKSCSSIPGHALHEKGLKSVGPLVSSQERRAVVVSMITARQSVVNRSSGSSIRFTWDFVCSCFRRDVQDGCLRSSRGRK